MESKNETILEQLAIDQSADLLIKAGGEGLKPSQKKIQAMLEAWGINELTDESAKQENERLKKDAEHASESAGDLKKKVDKIIQEYLEGGYPLGSRAINHILDRAGLKKNLNTGVIIRDSLEQSLDQNDTLEIIAHKITLLHDFPAEIGGGQHNRMVKAPELRKRILLRLLVNEVPKDSDNLEDETLLYVYKKVVSVWPWEGTHHEKEVIQNHTGSLPEKVIKLKLDFVKEQLQR